MTSIKFFKIRTFLFFSIGILLFTACSPDTEPDPNSPAPAITLTDQTYGPDVQQKFDIFLPQGRNLEETPIVIYLHGGAWIDGNKEEFLQFKLLMDQYFPGYAFASINYRLFNFNTGENTFPTQEEDVLDAVTFLKTKFSEWSIEGEITLAGASAGGHLALLHGLKHETVGPIHSVIAFFPPTDLNSLYLHNNVTAQGLQLILNGTPESNPENYFQSSPISFITENSVPVIFFHGTTDNVVPINQSVKFEEALAAKNVPHQFIKVEGQGHGFSPETYPALIQAAANFINEQK